MQIKTLVIAALSLPLLAAPAAAQLGGRMGGGADWFGEADANRDGVVTLEEFRAYRAGNFDKLDRNGDGAISPADFPRLAKLRPDAYQRLTSALEGADSNGDGAISRSEMANSRPVMFTLADADHDGRVTQAEFDAARERMKSAIAARRK